MPCLPSAAAVIASRYFSHRSTGHNKQFAAWQVASNSVAPNIIANDSTRIKNTGRSAWTACGSGGQSTPITGSAIANRIPKPWI